MEFFSALTEEEFYSSAAQYDEDVIEHRIDVDFLEIYRADFMKSDSYRRPMPDFLSGPDASFMKNIENYFTECNEKFKLLPASHLVEIADAYIKDNIVYLSKTDPARVLYETQRYNDRPFAIASHSLQVESNNILVPPTGKKYLFIGSAGSGNYGHWLIDDLPRATCIIQNPQDYILLLTSYGHANDDVKRQSINALFHDAAPPIVFLEAGVAYSLPDLWYVTPVSYHPTMKMRSSASKVRQAIGEAVAMPGDAEPSSLIFVARGGSPSRSLKNYEEILPLLTEYGFQIVQPETMPFKEQVRIFRNAKAVIGVMGAAMTNTLFSAPSTKIGYLVPNGWIEPFYWDLAAVLGHKYSASFGLTESEDAPAHLRAFRIEPDEMRKMLAHITA